MSKSTISNSWPKEKISPCCDWLSNPIAKTTSTKTMRCCKCGKEW